MPTHTHTLHHPPIFFFSCFVCSPNLHCMLPSHLAEKPGRLPTGLHGCWAWKWQMCNCQHFSNRMCVCAGCFKKKGGLYFFVSMWIQLKSHSVCMFVQMNEWASRFTAYRDWIVCLHVNNREWMCWQSKRMQGIVVKGCCLTSNNSCRKRRFQPIY